MKQRSCYGSVSLRLMNPFSAKNWFGSDNINKTNSKRVMGKTWVAGKRTTLGVGKRSSPGGRQDRVLPGVATLDRGPDQSPEG